MRQRAGHLFGPLLTRSRNLGLLCGPFPVEDMGNTPFDKFFVQYPDFFLASYAFWMWHILNCHPFLPVFNHIYPFSIPLFSPRWGTREGRGDVAILIYPHGDPEKAGCISRNFAFRVRSATHLMGHGTMSHLMFGLIKATQPPCKMRERMRQMCVCYAVRSAPPSQFVVSARSITVKNVLMPTLVGNKLFIRQYMMDTH